MRCLYCSSETNNPRFCSRSCSASYNNSKRPRRRVSWVCLNCGKELNKHEYTYCSIKCHREYEEKVNLENWKSGKDSGGHEGYGSLKPFVRRFVFERAQYKCEKCGWSEHNPFTGKLALEIDHINGDSSNNRPENLRVLCPNCHSLTEFHGILNKGRGRRKFREAYLKANKK